MHPGMLVEVVLMHMVFLDLVELTVPLTKTEFKELKEDLPGAVTEESKREPSFLGKLREFLAFSR